MGGDDQDRLPGEFAGENEPLDACRTAACQQWRAQIGQMLSEGQTEQQIKDNLMFAADKVGETMKTAMTVADGKAWFGGVASLTHQSFDHAQHLLVGEAPLLHSPIGAGCHTATTALALGGVDP